jgi:hypothetical protein
MFHRTPRLVLWAGGTAALPSLGVDLRHEGGRAVNVEKSIIAGTLPPEARKLRAAFHPFTKWNRQLRADIYDELLKLPLRYSLHSFDKIQAHQSQSAVGYAPPLGPADPDDVIPFFVHRNTSGRFQGYVKSMHVKTAMPAFYMRINGVEGDMFRFEEELIKIFPTKKTFVRPHCVYVNAAGRDAKMILDHWYMGLGF